MPEILSAAQVSSAVAGLDAGQATTGTWHRLARSHEALREENDALQRRWEERGHAMDRMRAALTEDSILRRKAEEQVEALTAERDEWKLAAGAEADHADEQRARAAHWYTQATEQEDAARAEINRLDEALVAMANRAAAAEAALPSEGWEPTLGVDENLNREWEQVLDRDPERAVGWALVTIFGGMERYHRDPVFHARVELAERMIDVVARRVDGAAPPEPERVYRWVTDRRYEVHAATPDIDTARMRVVWRNDESQHGLVSEDISRLCDEVDRLRVALSGQQDTEPEEKV